MAKPFRGNVVKSETLKHALMRWGGLVVLALVELTWLAIRVEVPSTGFLSCL